jgi:hypothetical protein
VATSGGTSIAATAQLEGWRLPVSAALQPVLVLDARLHLVAASSAAARLLLLPAPGRPLHEAVALQDVQESWDALPFVVAVRTGTPQRGLLTLSSAGADLDVVASPLFGTAGAIGALVFLTSA